MCLCVCMCYLHILVRLYMLCLLHNYNSEVHILHKSKSCNEIYVYINNIYYNFKYSYFNFKYNQKTMYTSFINL